MAVRKSVGAVERPVRERSGIAFPYVDLDDALSVANAIYTNAGRQASWDQLAAYLKHESANSGAFRLKVGAARLFGLVETSRNEVALSELGQDAVDPEKAKLAREEAFLKVPLYREVYDKYRGKLLPPDVGLEREMRDLGVPAKQVAKARQVFQRSADEAGYFAQGKDRLVRPAGSRARDAEPVRVQSTSPVPERTGPSGYHPFIEGLLQALPQPGTEWPSDERKKWLGTAENVFALMYKDGSATEPRED
jgi:hypothetical protein